RAQQGARPREAHHQAPVDVHIDELAAHAVVGDGVAVFVEDGVAVAVLHPQEVPGAVFGGPPARGAAGGALREADEHAAVAGDGGGAAAAVVGGVLHGHHAAVGRVQEGATDAAGEGQAAHGEAVVGDGPSGRLHGAVEGVG